MKLARQAIIGLGVALAVAVLVGWLVLRSSLPVTDGSVVVTGLHGPVEVIRDSHGIPTIRAANEADAYFALGFVHAQDRLWQMESIRRLGQGRLAEVIGDSGLNSDKFTRTLGLNHLAERQLAALRPEVVAVLEAYAAGVNAWVRSHHGALPPEFIALRHQPEPWRPADSLSWGRLMAIQLSNNWQDELLRVRLGKLLPPGRLADLWAPSPADATAGVAVTPPDLPADAIDALVAAVPEALQPASASNEWVVSGARTVTGRPMLANDPHLNFSAPVMWYLARIEAPGLKLAGATVPGVPFHILGHNGRFAWGLTTTHSDTQDVFIERLAKNGEAYDTPSGPQPFTVRHETIRVRDRPTVEITVRESRHGPIISDLTSVKSGDGYAFSLSAKALAPDDVTPQAFHSLARSGDWASFVATLTDFRAPQLNFAYADVSGTIGFIAPGAVPIRANGDGSAPVPGWTDSYDWVGTVPFERLPRVVNPPSGMLVNANNRIVPDDYPYLLTKDWPDSYRARRIENILAAQPHIGLPTMATMQTDTTSDMGRDLLPLMLDVAPAGDLQRKAIEMLRIWDFRMDRGRPEPLLFTAWVLELKRALFADELGDAFDRWQGEKPFAIKLALTTHTDWCDDVATPTKETCSDRIGLSLERALDRVTNKYGAHIATWRWGDAHRATFHNTVFQRFPLLDRLTGLSIPSDGGDFTVNRGTFTATGPATFNHIHGPGLRAIYDLADLDRSVFIIATGQSGNVLSSHYDDQLKIWRNGGTMRLDGAPKQTLRLTPPPKP